MSLLDNKKGLTILSALFLLFACEEPSDLPLGISPKQGRISSHYLEIPIESALLRTVSDSVISSMTSSNAPTLIGRVNNSQFGSLTATAFTNIGTPDSISYPSAAQLQEKGVDSVKLSLAFNNLFLGDLTHTSQTLKVYRLKNAIRQKPANPAGNLQYRYFTTDSETLNMEADELIGEVTFDTTSINSGGTPSTVWIHLENSFGNKIWQEMKDNPATFRTQEAMDAFIGSLAIVPGEDNTFINGYIFNSAVSAIDIYFDDPDITNSFYISFPFRPLLNRQDGREYSQLPTYYNLSPNYDNTALEGTEDRPSGTLFQASDNQLYFRSGVGLLPKLSFPSLEDFVTSNNIENVIINSAILEIDSVPRRVGSNLRAPSQISFYLVDNQNNNRFPGVRNEAYAGAPMPAQQYITAQNDTLLRYRADIAEELEEFINLNKRGNINQSRNFLQGMIYHSNSVSLPASLPNLVADPQRMVLKIYYTTLVETNKDN